MTHRNAVQSAVVSPAPRPGIERRQFGRRTTVWHAWIITQGGRRTACVLRNVSEGGALLELDVPAWLPISFTVAIEEYGLSAVCDLRHRGQHGVGVSFVDTADGRRFVAASQSSSATVQKVAPMTDPRSEMFVRPRLSPELIRGSLTNGRG